MINELCLMSCLVIFSGCVALPKHEIEADRIMNAYTYHVEKAYGFRSFAVGGGMMDDVKSITLKYIAYEKVDIPTARKMLVQNIEDLLKTINSDEKIRPYLHNYPFTVNNLKFGLCFFDSNNDWIEPPYLGKAILLNGKIHYSLWNEPKDMLETQEEETYEEALQKVNGSNQ